MAGQAIDSGAARIRWEGPEIDAGSPRIVVPSLDDTLPEALDEAVGSLRSAKARREEGDPKDACALAWISSERVARWLEDEERIQKPANPRAPGTHGERRYRMARYLGFPQKRLDDLAVFKDADIYRNREVKGWEGKAVGVIATAAIETAVDLLRAVAARRNLLTANQQQALRWRLENLTPGLLGDARIRAIEEEVLRGNHGFLVDQELAFLVRRFNFPQNELERRRAGHLFLVAAHAAMNHGVWAGPAGTISWARHALDVFEAIPDVEEHRIAHLHRITAVALRHLGELAAARRALAQAKEKAKSHQRAIHLIRNQEALLDARMGLIPQALGLARDLRHQAEDWGQADLAARRLFTEGVLRSLGGQYAEAEAAILESSHDRESDFVMAQAFTTLALLFVAERARQLDTAREHARVLALLSKPRNLCWHLSKAQAVMRHLDGPNRNRPFQWGYDVY